MRRLEKLGDEVQREWYEAMVALESMEEGEAEKTEEEEVEEEGVGSSEVSKYSTEVDYEELDRTDGESE